jgi:hypothetical protein
VLFRSDAAARLALMCALGAATSVALFGCAAEPEAGATPSISSSATRSASPEPTPSPTSSPTGATDSPSPAPSDAAGDVAVTLITLEYVGDGVEATGVVAGLVEDGGECVLTLESAGVALEATGQAAAATDSTYCGLVGVRDPRLTPGTWTATLTYRSAAHTGVSERMTVEVPA